MVLQAEEYPMTDHAISRFPVPDVTDLPEDLRTRILAVQEKAGFVPNVSWFWPIGPRSCAPSWPTTTP